MYMNIHSAWNKFLSSGSVADYLSYKAAANSNDVKELNCLEIHNRRTDNKNGQCR